jgi:hypothetical protein
MLTWKAVPEGYENAGGTQAVCPVARSRTKTRAASGGIMLRGTPRLWTLRGVAA